MYYFIEVKRQRWCIYFNYRLSRTVRYILFASMGRTKGSEREKEKINRGFICGSRAIPVKEQALGTSAQKGLIFHGFCFRSRPPESATHTESSFPVDQFTFRLNEESAWKFFSAKKRARIKIATTQLYSIAYKCRINFFLKGCRDTYLLKFKALSIGKKPALMGSFVFE